MAAQPYVQNMAHVTFIHGIGNKPAEDALLDRWERSLADGDGIDLGTRGITSKMVYWADVLYPEPAEESYESTSDVPTEEVSEVDLDYRKTLDGHELAWVDRFAEDLGVDVEEVADAPPEDDIGPEFERIPLPHWLKRTLMATLLRDVHHYLFNAPHRPREGQQVLVQEEIRRRMVEALEEGAERPGPHVLVSHSMGTVIAYDCLKRLDDCPRVDGLLTIGSPLGRHEIPDELRPHWSRQDGFPSRRLVGAWVNVFDHFDPVVGAYPYLGLLYRHEGEVTVLDVNEQNWGKWRHDIAKYLRGTELRAQLASLLEI